MNTFTGATKFSTGTLEINTIKDVGDTSGSSLGNVANSTDGTISFTNAGATTLRYTGSGSTTNRILSFEGNNAIDTIDASGTGALVFSNAVTAQAGASAHPLVLSGTNANDNTIAGALINNGANVNTLTKSGSGKWVLTGASTYTGTTKINEGILSVSSINSVTGGTATSNLGAPSSAANGIITLGLTTTTGTLLYTGTGETTDRAIFLGGSTGGGVIDQSGTGLLKFSTNFSAPATGANKTLTLQGSTAGTGEISGIIRDKTAVTDITSVAKAGSGTWTLSAINTYSGGTTVSAGTLLVNTTQTAGNSGTGAGNVGVTAGTLGGIGIIRPGTGNSVTVSSGAFLAPGDSTAVSTIGTLVVDGGGTTAALLTMSSGSKFSFDLGTGVSSDKLNVWNYVAGDFAISSNAVNFTLDASVTTGSHTFNLFNFYTNNGVALSSATFSGLAFGTLSSNIGAHSFDYTTPGQINLIVTAVPEPATWALLAFSLTTVMVLRRRKA